MAAMLIEDQTKIADLFKLLRKDQKRMTKVSVREVANFVKSLQKLDIAKKDADKSMTLLNDSKVTALGGGQREKKAPFYISLR